MIINEEEIRMVSNLSDTIDFSMAKLKMYAMKINCILNKTIQLSREIRRIYKPEGDKKVS